jgi:hypothetical protein
MMIRRIVLIYFLGHSVLWAQETPYDKQLWSGLNVEFNEISKLDLGLSYQSRFDRNIQRFRGSYITANASYKLKKGFRWVVAMRAASSPRFDKLRFSGGFTKNFELGKSTSIKLRALWQYQMLSGSDLRYGLNVPQQNYRFRISIKQKIARKTWITLQTEPLWRKELQAIHINRLRSSVQIDRSLPGPWSVSMGYIIQQGLGRGTNFHGLLCEISYELKFKKKAVNQKP